MIMAYILLHYEIEPLKERPGNCVYGNNVFPDRGAAIRIRRRKENRVHPE